MSIRQCFVNRTRVANGGVEETSDDTDYVSSKSRTSKETEKMLKKSFNFESAAGYYYQSALIYQ